MPLGLSKLLQLRNINWIQLRLHNFNISFTRLTIFPFYPFIIIYFKFCVGQHTQAAATRSKI